jgi:hypothetical protein
MLINITTDTPYHLKNPDGYSLAVGHDFVEAVMDRNQESTQHESRANKLASFFHNYIKN